MKKQEMINQDLGEHRRASVADPLFRLLRRFSMRPGLTACLTGVVMSIWYFASGLVVDAIFKGQGYVSIMDPNELSFGLFIWVFWAPIIMFYYLWQPSAVLGFIADIEDNGIFEPESAIAELRKEIQEVLNSLTIPVAALLTTTVITLTYALIVVPGESAAQGKPTFWFRHWFTCLMMHAVFAAFVYMIVAFVFRNVMITRKMGQFFSRHRHALHLKVFHPDQCGGMAPLGEFSARLGMLAVMFGLFAAFFSLRPVLWGGRAVVNAGTIMMYLAYVILVPMSIAPYIWSAHKAMRHFKQNRLLQISSKMDLLINEVMTWTDEQTIEREGQDYHINMLVELYDLLDKRTPVWPISLPRIRSFGITAILPLLLGGFQFVLDIGQQLGWF